MAAATTICTVTTPAGADYAGVVPHGHLDKLPILVDKRRLETFGRRVRGPVRNFIEEETSNRSIFLGDVLSGEFAQQQSFDRARDTIVFWVNVMF